MAVKDSVELKTDEQYPLGEYSFHIERSSGTSPGYDKIEAICTKGGKNARKSIQIPSSAQLVGWYVEANETEASVYVIVGSQKVPIGDFSYTTTSSFTASYMQSGKPVYDSFYSNSSIYACMFNLGNTNEMVWASKNPFVVQSDVKWGQTEYHHTYNGIKSSFDGEDFYYYAHGAGYYHSNVFLGTSLPVNAKPANYSAQLAAAKMVFDDSGDGNQDMLVGRFAIDIEDAGGDGPGSDWDDPGDYDPDWEEGDPTHTLYVTVTGALSGRHNDPIEDPSYSYLPFDKNTVKDYGCGGDGGHGGGGGAGASTVVIHKFATNQANSKEVTAIARRHGYGSGGGKGGKGGDGCILVYY